MDNKLPNFLGKPTKPSLPEWVMISAFFITMLITWIMPIAIFAGFSSFAIFMLSREFLRDEKFKKKAIYFGDMIFVALILMFLIDTSSTYYMVLIEKVAIEANPFVVFMWNNFGILFGEIIRLSMGFTVFIFTKKKLRNQNPKVALTAMIMMVIMFFTWVWVLDNNISILYTYQCTK